MGRPVGAGGNAAGQPLPIWLGSPGPRESTLKKFKKIFVEITNRCNRRCSFCQPSARPQAFMAPAEFAAILARLAGHTNYLVPHVLGEALLHPDLPLLLQYCHDRGLRVNLATNGVLLGRRGAILLASPALRQVNISLHSFEEEEGGVGLADYLAGIFDFIREARATGALLIGLRLWNAPESGKGTAGPVNREILRRLAAFFQLPGALAELPSAGHGLTLAPGVFLSQDRRFNWPHAPAADLGERGFCRALRDHLAILVDGTVVPCCLDAEGDMPLGNIHRQPLAEILAHPRAQAIYRGFSAQRVVEPLCRRCGYRLRFAPGVGAEPAPGGQP